LKCRSGNQTFIPPFSFHMRTWSRHRNRCKPDLMSLDRQIMRLTAVVILAIIAYVAPSAVQAHDGHAHHGRHQSTTQANAAPPVATRPITLPSRIVGGPAETRLALDGQSPAAEPLSSLQADDAGGRCCPVGCRGSCCGTMVCCPSGVVAGAASLSRPLSGNVVLIPHDVDARSGVDPEALPEPPRTLA